MRLLGIDPGSRRCGIAVSNSDQTMAFPRAALATDANLITALGRLVDEEGIGGFVVGRPVALSGRTTASTDVATRLVDDLTAAYPSLSVVQWDERLTTVQAQRNLSEAGISTRHQRSHVDSAAAVILLQNYLDAHRTD